MHGTTTNVLNATAASGACTCSTLLQPALSAKEPGMAHSVGCGRSVGVSGAS